MVANQFGNFRRDFPRAKIHKRLLVRSDLMNEDMVETCFDVWMNGIQVFFGIRTARDYCCDLVN